MDATPPSPWQAPPPWLAARLVAHLLAEPRSPLIVADLRLISRGWLDAVGDTLPALAPRRYLPASEAAAAASRFPGLRLLCLDSPAQEVGGTKARLAQQAAALAAVCASCTGLRTLMLQGWQLPQGGLQPLSSLVHLTRLELHTVAAGGGDPGGTLLPQLPLRHLRAHCPHLSLAEACRFTALTRLELSNSDKRPQLLPELAQRLPHLLRMEVVGLTGEQCEHIHHLSALTALTSLCLHTSHETMGLPLPALQQLLAGGRLRQLSLLGQCGFEQHLPLSALSGLESLALDIAEIQLEPRCVSCLTRLTDLTLNVGSPLYQASLLQQRKRAPALHQQPTEMPRQPSAAQQAEPEEVDAFVGTIGRRLTGLRRLALTGAQHLSEAAIVHISGLTGLTELLINDAHDFGGPALEALRPLAALHHLSLSNTSLNPVALASVLNDEGESGLPLLPALTYLALRSCRLLSAPDVARLACSLPSLQHLRLIDWPHMDQPTLEHILMHSPSLQLLQTAWRPPAAPHIPAGAEPGAQQQQELQRFEQAHAFCCTWRLKLQHSFMPTWILDDSFEEALAEAASQALPA